MLDLNDDGCLSKLHVPEAGMLVDLAEQPLLELPAGRGRPSKLYHSTRHASLAPFPPTTPGRTPFSASSLRPLAVLRIRIRMFLGLPDPDPLVRGTAPDPELDPDPPIIKQKY
jgi:hypothetical protein